jgi:hypothetical protein
MSVGDSDVWDVVAVRLDDGAVVPVTEDGLAATARWGPAGIAFPHDHELMLVGEPGAEAAPIPVPPADVVHSVWLPVAWSADGGRPLLTTGCAHGCQEAAVYDLRGGTLTHLGLGAPAAISRDGERVLLQQDCDSGLAMAEPRFPLAVVEVDTLVRSTPIPATTCGASWSP